MGQTDDNFYRHMGVYTICVSNGRILVIQKVLGPYIGRYDLPGGRLERGETLEQAVIREFQEETGYCIKNIENIGVCDFIILWNQQDGMVEHIHHIAILYEGTIDSEKLINSIEDFEGQDSCGAIWIPIKEVTPDNSSPLVLQAIEWVRSRTISVKPHFFDLRISTKSDRN